MNQRDIKNDSLHKYGCYFFDLLYIANGGELDQEEVLAYYNIAVVNGYLTKDCFVLDPAAILKLVNGKDYYIKKTTDFDENADHIIGYFYYKEADTHHFVVLNKDKTLKYDSLVNSRTFKHGKIESYRLVYEKR